MKFFHENSEIYKSSIHISISNIPTDTCEECEEAWAYVEFLKESVSKKVYDYDDDDYDAAGDDAND